MARIDLQTKVCERVKALKAYHVDNYDAEIKLHANENSHSLPPAVVEQFGNRLRELDLNRYPDPDCADLKKTLARQLNINHNQLTIGNGSDELIQILIQIFCDPGDALAIPDPTFAMYNIIAKGLGVRPIPYSLNEHWDLEAKPFLDSIRDQKVRLIFFSYPNNPTGNCFNKNEIQKVIEEFDGIVVLDEAYYDFARLSFIEQLSNHNNLIVLRSLSKIGLAGLRVGYGIATPEIIQEIDKIRLPYNSNMLSQEFSDIVLSQFELVKEQINEIIEERERIRQSLSEIEGVTSYKSDANFILFQTEKSSRDVFNELAKRGILIRDLGAHPRLKNCLRVTIGTRDENNFFLKELKAISQTA
ncbi:MAG: histidinol-phosphate transaminase [Candidatus Nitronauta litoralis]|uniref:Histidinol-phosphate aminotransferase n=1 Tax=Candidatus Nitronauta litoralis TaxID=2705533 RepID=A0A7T0G121_9BACT|nr:MAG: histidinol-phosphate transaminase [Candidatus Nitronauta litoralis]